MGFWNQVGKWIVLGFVIGMVLNMLLFWRW